MLGFLTGAAAGWLALLAVLLAVPWTGPAEKAGAPGRRAGPFAGRDGPGADPARPSADPEPPAVVSLLAGRLEKDGYPATLLDLAARSWLRLDQPAGGPLMCVIPRDRPRERLTAYERQACAHVTLRASGLGQVPAKALGDGFPARGPAGPVGVPPAGDSLKSARENFAADFRREVIAGGPAPDGDQCAAMAPVRSASAGRAAGCLVRHAAIRVRRAGGIPVSAGSAWTTRYKIVAGRSVPNGGVPDAANASTLASENTSLAGPVSSPSACSGT